MSISARIWKRIGLALLVVLGVGLSVRYLVVPPIIRGQLQARYGGLVTFRGWWLNTTSAGVKNLALGEGPGRGSPIWARAARVETDLSIGKILRARFLPDRIVLERPEIVFRIDEHGRLLTLPPVKGGGGDASAVPDVVVKEGRVTLRQDGRPEMTIGPVQATLATGKGSAEEVLSAETRDPLWGRWTASGRFDPGFKRGEISLRSDGPLDVTPEKIARIPFVPLDVWTHVDPRGPVAIVVDLITRENPQVKTTCTFHGATLQLSTLGLVAERATGSMIVDRDVVHLRDLRGESIGGTIAAAGTLDFSQKPPRFDLRLDLKGVDVGLTPPSWHLADAGLTGRLTGSIQLRVALTPDGADLTGSSGDAVVEGGTIGGVAVKSFKIAMKADGEDLKYETKTGDTSGAMLPPYAIVPMLIGLQTPPPTPVTPKPTQATPPSARGGFVLPKTISTEVEFEDVDLTQVLARLHALKIPVPVPMAGRLSLKARATIPLGSIRDVKLYAFHGQATLRGAFIDGVDLGQLQAQVDLENGVLDLTDFRGRLVDRPQSDAGHPPDPTEPVEADGPLPPGGFRGRLHAELSPPGRLETHFEGQSVPVGELLVPVRDRIPAIQGLATFSFDAGAPVAKLDDPAAWTVGGKADAAKLASRGASLDRVATAFALKDGRLSLPDLAASLGGQPLKANLGLDVSPPRAFSAELDVAGWDLERVLAFLPSVPRPSPVGGKLNAVTKARGTLQPLEWSIEGEGLLKSFRAGPANLGDLPLKWRTEGDQMLLSIREARPQGGSIAAEARIPLRGEAPITGSATLRKVDVAGAADRLGGIPPMTGKVDGQAEFMIRTRPKPGEPIAVGKLTASAPDLTVNGVGAKNLQVVATAREGGLNLDLYAESLGGKMQLVGSLPIRGEAPGELSATFRAVGFRLSGLWKLLGVTGALADLQGTGAIDANLLTHLRANDLRTRGKAEVRDLKWGADFPLGTLKGNVTLTPTGWRVDDLGGDVVGGIARGSVVGSTPAQGANRIEFNLDIDRASLARALAIQPTLAAAIDGTGSFRLAGTLAEAFRASGEFSVGRATLFGFPVSELRAPIELQYAPNGNLGALSVRRWSGRIAGGRLTGDARFGIGTDRSFTTDLQVGAVDVESVARVLTDARRPASGKVSGKISVNGADPAKPDGYRGRIDLNLDAASLFELPVFREIERFLGSARGGTFDQGQLKAGIVNRQIVIDTLTLEGKLVQLHATGTVGFDQHLELQVLVNTNQIIGQTGQALVALIPGLGDAVGRRNVAFARLGNYLQNRLLKFRVTGTIAQPTVQIDPTVAVAEGAVGFFAGAFRLPLELIR